MLFYRAALPLSHRTLRFASGPIRTHRREPGSRWRRLDAERQALLVLVHLRKGEPFAEIGAGFRVSATTCQRYVHETIELLAARSPRLRQALRTAKRQGVAYAVIDGTLIPIDRVAADRPLHSGKHRTHGVNPRVIASSDGTILWVSGDLPGSAHDTAAAGIWNILAALRDAGLIALGDKGYHGYDPTGWHVITPYKGRNKPESQKDANRAHARLRGPGERANAPTQDLARPAQTPLLSTPRWPTGQSRPRPTELRDNRRTKKAPCAAPIR